MAFGLKRRELAQWKSTVSKGEIAFLTHYWLHPKYPGITSVTKVGCSDIERLIEWGRNYGLQSEWIHHRSEFPHFDLIGDRQKDILLQEGLSEQLKRFKILNSV